LKSFLLFIFPPRTHYWFEPHTIGLSMKTTVGKMDNNQVRRELCILTMPHCM